MISGRTDDAFFTIKMATYYHNKQGGQSACVLLLDFFSGDHNMYSSNHLVNSRLDGDKNIIPELLGSSSAIRRKASY
jgi:hypothetical protein